MTKLLVGTIFLILCSFPHSQTTNPHGDLVSNFLSRNKPLFEYEAIRTMIAVNGGTSVTLEVKAKLERGDQLAYTTLSDNSAIFLLNPKSWYMKNRVLDKILEKEKLTMLTSPNKYNYNSENYEFGSPVDLGGVWKLPITAKKRDEGFYIDGWLIVLPNGEMVQCDGSLVKSPDSNVRNTKINVRFKEFNGIRLPINYNSSADVRLFGHSTLHTTYTYKSVNGVAVTGR